MMRLTVASLAFLVLTTVPAGASAGVYSHGFDTGKDAIAWAIVSGDNTSMSDMRDLDSLDKLKSEFGEEFLYIRQGGDRYVIRDRALIKRAQDALLPMQDAGREIGEAARAQAEQALKGSHDAREQARLARRIAKLDGKIARKESRGESTRELEREQAWIQRDLDDLEENSEHDSRDHETMGSEHRDRARTRDASERMHRAARQLNQEMRDILRDSKSRHLAEPVR